MARGHQTKNPATKLTGAFTLIELLVVIGIIAILAGLLLPVLTKAKQKGKQANEISAGRQLMLAWTMYAGDNSDNVLPGYIFPKGPVAYDDQNQLIDPALPDGARYPWRLAPYLANNFRSIYVNEGRAWLEQQSSHSQYVYNASLYPSLGYNTVFLGGDSAYDLTIANAAAYGYATDWLITRASQISRPSELITFGSACYRDPSTGNFNFGFFKIWPPYSAARKWGANFSPADPTQWGYVHPRWNNHAVTAMTDGHAESLNSTELQDMRHWCNTATKPDWVVPQN